MATVSYINSSNQEALVTPSSALPTSAIDGYQTATAYVVNISGGANAVALASVAGKAIDIFNNTGQDLEYSRNGSTVFFPIPNGTARLIVAIGGMASNIAIRRMDRSTTALTPVYEVLA